MRETRIMVGNRNPIKWIGNMPAGEYAIIPNELARDGRLSSAARSVALYLWTHRDGYELSTVSIGEKLNVDRDTVSRALDQLSEHRWIAICKTVGNGRIYRAHRARKLTDDEHATLSGNPAGSDEVCGEIPQGDAGKASKMLAEKSRNPMPENPATNKTTENTKEKTSEKAAPPALNECEACGATYDQWGHACQGYRL